jgi:hypothetical protein
MSLRPSGSRGLSFTDCGRDGCWMWQDASVDCHRGRWRLAPGWVIRLRRHIRKLPGNAHFFALHRLHHHSTCARYEHTNQPKSPEHLQTNITRRPIPLSNMAVPSAHSQPSMQQAYKAADNPVTKEPAERDSSHVHKASSETVEKRLPHDQSTESDYPGSASDDRGPEDLGERRDFDDAGGMAPASEGKVRDAVVGSKTGASGSEPDFASDLDRCKSPWLIPLEPN